MREKARRRLPPSVAVWLALSVLTSLPYLRAQLAPPPGKTFIGVFYWSDDFYNYLGFVQQARDGAFLFRDKLQIAPHPPSLVNLEWWVVGRLAAWVGNDPFLAYRLVGLVASLFLLLALERWLRRVGVPEARLTMSLLLVTLGGGAGGVLAHLVSWPLKRHLELWTGLFPFIELLANPHFLVGTTLLLWSLWLFMENRPWLAVLTTSVAALSRPYDAVLIVLVRVATIPLTEPRREWLARAAPLVGLVPVALLDAFLFYGTGFRWWTAIPATRPPWLDFLRAVGPAAVLALAAARATGGGPEARRARTHLVVWIGAVTLILLAQPVSFSLQFMVGLGLPLLTLGALGLLRLRRAVAIAVLATLSASALTTWGYMLLLEDVEWYAPSAEYAAAQAPAGRCGPDDVLLAPPEISLYSLAFSACRVFVAHPAAPGHPARVLLVHDFYFSWPPGSRARFLDQLGITRLFLPGDAGPVPVGWLGPSTRFRQVARVGSPRVLLSLYARPPQTPEGP
jgi:hypothetical protein